MSSFPFSSTWYEWRTVRAREKGEVVGSTPEGPSHRKCIKDSNEGVKTRKNSTHFK